MIPSVEIVYSSKVQNKINEIDRAIEELTNLLDDYYRGQNTNLKLIPFLIKDNPQISLLLKIKTNIKINSIPEKINVLEN